MPAENSYNTIKIYNISLRILFLQNIVFRKRSLNQIFSNVQSNVSSIMFNIYRFYARARAFINSTLKINEIVTALINVS